MADEYLTLKQLKKKNRPSRRFLRKASSEIKKRLSQMGRGISKGALRAHRIATSEKTKLRAMKVKKGLQRFGKTMAVSVKKADRAIKPGAYGKKVSHFNKAAFDNIFGMSSSKSKKKSKKKLSKDPFDMF